MSVTFSTASSGTTYEVAKTLTARREVDRSLYRPPYGSTVHTSGTGERLPETVVVEVETWGSSAAQAAKNVMSVARSATILRTPYWTVNVAGVQLVAPRPVKGRAYRVRVEMLTAEARSYLPPLVTQDGRAILTQAGQTIGAQGT